MLGNSINTYNLNIGDSLINKHQDLCIIIIDQNYHVIAMKVVKPMYGITSSLKTMQVCVQHLHKQLNASDNIDLPAIIKTTIFTADYDKLRHEEPTLDDKINEGINTQDI